MTGNTTVWEKSGLHSGCLHLGILFFLKWLVSCLWSPPVQLELQLKWLVGQFQSTHAKNTSAKRHLEYVLLSILTGNKVRFLNKAKKPPQPVTGRLCALPRARGVLLWVLQAKFMSSLTECNSVVYRGWPRWFLCNLIALSGLNGCNESVFNEIQWLTCFLLCALPIWSRQK